MDLISLKLYLKLKLLNMLSKFILKISRFLLMLIKIIYYLYILIDYIPNFPLSNKYKDFLR